MANLMLTNGCNLACPYCFGRDLVGKGHGRMDMSLELVRDLVDWVMRAEHPTRIHLMGGEPTLHPEMVSILELLRDVRADCLIFSNAATKLDDAIVSAAERLDARWVVNVNDPGMYSALQFERLRGNLTRLGGRGVLTFNVTPEVESYQTVLDLVGSCGLRPLVKLGFTLPTLSRSNKYVRTHELRDVGQKILTIVEACASRGYKVEFECGAPWCMFTKDELERVRDTINLQTMGACASRLDIAPNGELFYCLPFYNLGRVPYHQFEHYGEAVRWFHARFLPYQAFGMKPECRTCEYHDDGRCCGGCLAVPFGDLQGVVPFASAGEGAQQPGSTARAQLEE